jgi:Mg-chelatase subunit ChlD
MARKLFAAALLFAATASPSLAARERSGSVDVFLVLDESGSMKPIFSRVTAFLADALVNGYLEPDDYLCIIGFSDRSRIRVSQRLSSEEEKENLAELVRSLNVVPQGTTDMGRALEEAIRQLGRLSHPSHQQILLILTDGVNQPPFDSPYYAPLRPAKKGSNVPPPSDFNARFLEQVRTLSSEGFQMHVVGIGAETDAKKLGEALGAGYTLLREFNLEELTANLARFWDETINLVGVSSPDDASLPGETIEVHVAVASTSDQDREVRLRGAQVVALKRLAARANPSPDASSVTVRVEPTTWAVPARQEARFDIGVLLPAEFPAGDFEATLRFDQESAVKFYPPEATFTFHVPSFWERFGFTLGGAAAGLAFLGVVFVLHRRRPIPVTMVLDGESSSIRPVPLRIHGHCTVGGGASDRFRITGLPQKVAVLERRSVDRFAVLSSHPELLPTIAEYTLGQPIEVASDGGSGKRVVRFVRFQRKPKGRVPKSTAPAPSAKKHAPEGGVDFR